MYKSLTNTTNTLSPSSPDDTDSMLVHWGQLAYQAPEPQVPEEKQL